MAANYEPSPHGCTEALSAFMLRKHLVGFFFQERNGADIHNAARVQAGLRKIRYLVDGI